MIAVRLVHGENQVALDLVSAVRSRECRIGNRGLCFSVNVGDIVRSCFAISEEVMGDLYQAVKQPGAYFLSNAMEEQDASEIRYATIEDGIERIKDKILTLSWDDAELLVAGFFRAIGYKTTMTSKGNDRGRDIIASHDGLGLESPRIFAEVKHRKGQMGAPQVRSFIGSLRPNDSGLYVSTGGFSKEARYEAERATVPVCLLDLDQFVRLLIENYESTDMKTKALLPLVRVYLPA